MTINSVYHFMMGNRYARFLSSIVFSWPCKLYSSSFNDLDHWLWIHKVCLLHV